MENNPRLLSFKQGEKELEQDERMWLMIHDNDGIRVFFKNVPGRFSDLAHALIIGIIKINKIKPRHLLIGFMKIENNLLTAHPTRHFEGEYTGHFLHDLFKQKGPLVSNIIFT